MNIEFVQGNEQHSSYWGKYYVKGLESWQVKEDFSQNRKDNHYSNQGYVCLDVPENTVFTIFEQNGNKRGTDEFVFTICKAALPFSSNVASYGSGFCTGNFEIIIRAIGKTKGPRLLDWWTKRGDADPLEYAQLCAKYIEKRGIKDLPLE